VRAGGGGARAAVSGARERAGVMGVGRCRRANAIKAHGARRRVFVENVSGAQAMEVAVEKRQQQSAMPSNNACVFATALQHEQAAGEVSAA